MTTAAQVLSQFQATGVQTCFHDRHINPQIYAGLNGSNWSSRITRPGEATRPWASCWARMVVKA